MWVWSCLFDLLFWTFFFFTNQTELHRRLRIVNTARRRLCHLRQLMAHRPVSMTRAVRIMRRQRATVARHTTRRRRRRGMKQRCAICLVVSKWTKSMNFINFIAHSLSVPKIAVKANRAADKELKDFGQYRDDVWNFEFKQTTWKTFSKIFHPAQASEQNFLVNNDFFYAFIGNNCGCSE